MAMDCSVKAAPGLRQFEQLTMGRNACLFWCELVQVSGGSLSEDGRMV